jgi:nucleotide-binding universal stress UspA family protein
MAADNLAGASVVVGVDGSERALTAVRLAASEAERRDRALEIMCAVDWPMVDALPEPDLSGRLESALRVAAEHAVTDAATAARGVTDRVHIATSVLADSPSGALLAASRHAALVVLGVHGHHPIGRYLAGSTTVQVATHASCPVLVARGAAAVGGPVVLGVDGSPRAAGAVGFAFEEAALRGVPLIAIHAGRGGTDADDPEARLLSEALSGWSGTYPEVTVDARRVRGGAVPALLGAAAGAALVVAGSCGHGGFGEVMLGSVGLRLVHHAPCPVAVVRPGVHASVPA